MVLPSELLQNSLIAHSCYSKAHSVQRSIEATSIVVGRVAVDKGENSKTPIFTDVKC